MGIGTINNDDHILLDVNGPIKGRSITLTDNAGQNSVLVSDADGLGTWTPISSFDFDDHDWDIEEADGDVPLQNLYLNQRYYAVGIGTTSPKSMLHIMDGNILISRSPSKAPGSRNGSMFFGKFIDPVTCPRGEWGIENKPTGDCPISLPHFDILS